MQKQQQLFLEKDTLVSIDPKKNRYRGYQIEMTKTKPKKVSTKWGRVKKEVVVQKVHKKKICP